VLCEAGIKGNQNERKEGEPDINNKRAKRKEAEKQRGEGPERPEFEGNIFSQIDFPRQLYYTNLEVPNVRPLSCNGQLVKLT
jgi:hypothetical protein